MTLVKYVKSSKVLGIILGLVLSLCTIFSGKVSAESMQDVATIAIVTETTNNNSIILDNNFEIRRASQMSQIYGTRLRVGATAYCGDTITSTGTVPIEGNTIAVDPSIIPYGSKVYIPKFNRVFIAEDCGSAIKGNRIDIFMTDYNRCMEWGYQDIDIYILAD